MVDPAVDRVDAGTDQGASGVVDRPGGGEQRQVLNLLRDALVQSPFPRADLAVGRGGKQVVDAGGDQRMGVEDLRRVLGGDGDRLDQRRGGTVLGRTQREIAADPGEQQRRHDRPDQQRAQCSNGAKRRSDPRPRRLAGRRRVGVTAVVGFCQYRHGANQGPVRGRAIVAKRAGRSTN
jgi:hypothetical protein